MVRLKSMHYLILEKCIAINKRNFNKLVTKIQVLLIASFGSGRRVLILFREAVKVEKKDLAISIFLICYQINWSRGGFEGRMSWGEAVNYIDDRKENKYKKYR